MDGLGFIKGFVGGVLVLDEGLGGVDVCFDLVEGEGDVVVRVGEFRGGFGKGGLFVWVDGVELVFVC